VLLGPYRSIEWVLLDPLPGRLAKEDTQANLVGRERFLERLSG
jgi:hypothetical protein